MIDDLRVVCVGAGGRVLKADLVLTLSHCVFLSGPLNPGYPDSYSTSLLNEKLGTVSAKKYVLSIHRGIRVQNETYPQTTHTLPQRLSANIGRVTYLRNIIMQEDVWR